MATDKKQADPTPESSEKPQKLNVVAESDPAAPKAQKASEPEVNTSTEDFVFVTMPDGTTRAFTRAEIRDSQARSATEVQNGTVTQPTAPEEDPEVYLWLADGSVERVKTSELPGAAGTNAANGYYERDGHIHHVVAVYPVETKKG